MKKLLLLLLLVPMVSFGQSLDGFKYFELPPTDDYDINYYLSNGFKRIGLKENDTNNDCLSVFVTLDKVVAIDNENIVSIELKDCNNKLILRVEANSFQHNRRDAVGWTDKDMIQKSARKVAKKVGKIKYRFNPQLTPKDSYEKKLIIGGVDIREINVYDLKAMVNYFIDDCKKNNINLPFTNNIIIEFIELGGNVIGVSTERNNDSVINLKIDPENWSKSSLQKKWYLLYHELGHDVLNLGHGEGGKMMFNFIDRDYEWEEFVTDKNYMFNYFKQETYKAGGNSSVSNTNNAPTEYIRKNTNMSAEEYFNRGRERLSSEDYYGAIEDFTAAIEIKPNYANAYFQRAYNKFNIKDYYGAINDYSKAIELNPDYVDAYNNRGNAKINLKDYYGAINDLSKAIELNPDYVDAYNNRGSAKYLLGDFNGACGDWRKAASLGSQSSAQMVRDGCN